MTQGEPKVLLYGHGGSGNRGCEALIRSTTTILRKAFGDSVQITVASFRVREDVDAHIPYISNYISHCRHLRRLTPSWVKFQFYKRVMHDYIRAFTFFNYPTINYVNNVDICLSVGGDNYCYETPYWLYAIDRAVKAVNKKLILWGTSIEPSFIDTEMEKDLRLFDLITARESITYEALENKRLINLHLCPDPAFVMEREDPPLPVGWQDGKTIGINISPLVMKYERQSGLTLRSVYALMKHILETTDNSIALIPHVTWPYNDDREPLRQLLDSFPDTHRVIWIDGNYSAPQLKGLISHCRLFIGARTHSTIAAYSSCVPTLALGYSVKARGIAKDILGTESLVLAVQRLSSEREMLHIFGELCERENELRGHMNKIMPSYISAAWEAGKLVRKLLE